MATPNAGYKGLCGVGKETEWGTLVAPAELMPYTEESLVGKIIHAQKNILKGKAGTERPTKVGVEVGGGLTVWMGYQDTDLLVAAFCGGGAGAPSGTGPYVHTIDQSEDILRSLSYLIEKQTNVYEIAGGKVNSVTINGAPLDPVTAALDIVGKLPSRSTTHRAALAALALSGKPFLYHPDLTFRIGDCINALDETDDQEISEYSLSVNNNLVIDHRSCKSGEYIKEPKRNARREVSLTLTLPEHEADTYHDWRDNATKLQATIHYQRTVGATTYGFKISLPTLTVISCEASHGGPEIAPVAVELQCDRNDGNTNMSGITEQLQIEITNDRSTAIWA